MAGISGEPVYGGIAIQYEDHAPGVRQNSGSFPGSAAFYWVVGLPRAFLLYSGNHDSITQWDEDTGLCGCPSPASVSSHNENKPIPGILITQTSMCGSPSLV